MFKEALERAKELDAVFKRTGKAVGPLHGLPISLKDTYDVQGKVHFHPSNPALNLIRESRVRHSCRRRLTLLPSCSIERRSG